MKDINCPSVEEGIAFFYDHIRFCCSNVLGPKIIDNYKGEIIDWELFRYKTNEFKKTFAKGQVPECCANCYQIELFKSKDIVANDTNQIKKLFISHWQHCNAGCLYCSNMQITKGEIDQKIKKSAYYDVFPVIKQMVSKKILSPDAQVTISGGEPTVLKEFKDLINLLVDYVKNPIHIPTSAIIYDKSIEKCLKKNKCYLVISIDSGTAETFHKIKRVPYFEKVVANIRRYLKSSPFAKESIVLKYILMKGVNDNVEELEKWLIVAKELKIRDVELAIDYSYHLMLKSEPIPKHYYQMHEYIQNKASELGLRLFASDQTKELLTKGHVF